MVYTGILNILGIQKKTIVLIRMYVNVIRITWGVLSRRVFVVLDLHYI